MASPVGTSVPGGNAAATMSSSAWIPMTGIPVLVLHGPIPIRAALGLTPDILLVRPLAPLVPSLRMRRDEITAVNLEDGHWSALGRRVVSVRRVKGPTVRLMAPTVPGIADGTDNLGHLLRAWWRYGQR